MPVLKAPRRRIFSDVLSSTKCRRQRWCFLSPATGWTNVPLCLMYIYSLSIARWFKSNQIKHPHKATHGQADADPNATSRVANPEATQAWGGVSPKGSEGGSGRLELYLMSQAATVSLSLVTGQTESSAKTSTRRSVFLRTLPSPGNHPTSSGHRLVSRNSNFLIPN